MDSKKIEINITDVKVFKADRITFDSVFLLKWSSLFEQELEGINNHFLKFLQESKFDFTGPFNKKIDNNGHKYSYPSYHINLSYQDYLLLEEYRNNNPKVSGTVRKSEFSKEAHEELLEHITTEARQQAQDLADVDDLVLNSEFTFEKLPVIPKKWNVLPPLSARINHFLQPLEASYKFIFTTE